MSRSYRKPWIKDPANTRMKILHARRMRRITRQITDLWAKTHPDEHSVYCYCDLEWDEDIDCWGPCPHSNISYGPVYPHSYEITNPYDVCDFRFAIWGRTWDREIGGWVPCPEDRIKACRK